MSSELASVVLRGGNAAGRWGCVIMRRRGLAVARCGCGVEPCGEGCAAVRRGGTARRDGAAMGSRGVTVRRWLLGGVVYKNDDSFQI